MKTQLETRTVVHCMHAVLERTLQVMFGPSLESVLELYRSMGCPDHKLRPRPDSTRENELARIPVLLEFWGKFRVRKLSVSACFRFHSWRVPRLTRDEDGNRTVELDLTTLRNALHCAAAVGQIRSFPSFRWPNFRKELEIRHCRECAPANEEELNTLAHELLHGHRRTQVLGFLLLFLAESGLRTCEAVILRVDATQEGQPGYISPEKQSMWVDRGKNQQKVNPWVPIKPKLKETLKALEKWRKMVCPESPWLFPSPADHTKHVSRQSLTRALRRICPSIVGGSGA